MVANAGNSSAVFVVLQGMGEYDFVGLTEPSEVGQDRSRVAGG